VFQWVAPMRPSVCISPIAVVPTSQFNENRRFRALKRAWEIRWRLVGNRASITEGCPVHTSTKGYDKRGFSIKLDAALSWRIE
jgi:hypothetical protein